MTGNVTVSTLTCVPDYSSGTLTGVTRGGAMTATMTIDGGYTISLSGRINGNMSGTYTVRGNQCTDTGTFTLADTGAVVFPPAP